jgi:hypothetical protein
MPLFFSFADLLKLWFELREFSFTAENDTQDRISCQILKPGGRKEKETGFHCSINNE